MITCSTIDKERKERKLETKGKGNFSMCQESHRVRFLDLLEPCSSSPSSSTSSKIPPLMATTGVKCGVYLCEVWGVSVWRGWVSSRLGDSALGSSPGSILSQLCDLEPFILLSGLSCLRSKGRKDPSSLRALLAKTAHASEIRKAATVPMLNGDLQNSPVTLGVSLRLRQPPGFMPS